jgi:hypothetical protein
MCAITLTDWGAIAAIVAAAIAVISAFVISIRWLWHRFRLINAFKVYYEPVTDIIKCSYIAEASPDPQYLQVTLRMNTELNVEFVWIQFRGNGEIPTIKSLYDWNWGIGRKSPTINTYPVQGGTWYWHNYPPLRRTSGGRIKIGIEYVATQPFEGKLEFGLTAIEFEKAKVLALSFEVKIP